MHRRRPGSNLPSAAAANAEWRPPEPFVLALTMPPSTLERTKNTIGTYLTIKEKSWISPRSVPKHFQKRVAEPQVPPLRFAPVGMTILVCPQELRREIRHLASELSSRPERSVVEGPAVQRPFSGNVSAERSGQ